MIMKVVALFTTRTGKWARLRACGKKYNSHMIVADESRHTLLDVADEGYKLGDELMVTRKVVKTTVAPAVDGCRFHAEVPSVTPAPQSAESTS